VTPPWHRITKRDGLPLATGLALAAGAALLPSAARRPRVKTIAVGLALVAVAGFAAGYFGIGSADGADRDSGTP
jgi:hypothetical protein